VYELPVSCPVTYCRGELLIYTCDAFSARLPCAEIKDAGAGKRPLRRGRRLRFQQGVRHRATQQRHGQGGTTWLDVPQRIEYKLSVLVHRCQYGSAPQYLKDCCTSVADVPGRQHLRSARRQLMDVPRHRRTIFGRRAFSVTGPTVWNSLSNMLREQSDEDSFKRQLKTFLFSRTLGLAYPAH